MLGELRRTKSLEDEIIDQNSSIIARISRLKLWKKLNDPHMERNLIEKPHKQPSITYDTQ